MDIKKLLHKSPALSGEYPEFNVENAPDEPFDTFYEWFEHAVASDVLEPSAFVFSTVNNQGEPSARIVNLRDMTREHFIIGSNSESRKGLDMENNKNVAMTFYWRETGRQIRITGRVDKASETENKNDFIRRHPSSKALSIIAKQSLKLGSMKELDAEMKKSRALVEADENAHETWALYKVKPLEMEFFQARKDLAHIRLKYEKHEDGWEKDLLWP